MTSPTHDELLQQLRERGYAMIPDFLSAERLARVNQLYDAMLGSHSGRNNFEGNRTERIYTLVARDRVFQDIAEDPRVMALCDALLMPNYLLSQLLGVLAVWIGKQLGARAGFSGNALLRVREVCRHAIGK